ncbi:PAS domain S-box protein [Propionivibrio dicarboxylicus]|uniref:Sensory/regulatory protein RpfC n=1 Tax=Propionivibrio dicarboxylicus TaxID=83767 RepID=A0A1G8FLJ1_9RHOO|nr:PAS domain S-box protein [Propionivibrio dicarboxylicus]SDH82876.1 PAS domain S-box-containing protein [Propionivibrio dicarboxylicus]
MFGQPISLKVRITVAMLSVMVLALWVLSWFGSRSLRLDMESVLGNQQFATASYIAAEIENNVSARVAALELIAAAIPPKLFEKTPALQDFLDQRFVLHQQFNGGVMITGHDGVVIASTPKSLERIGHDFSDRDHIAAALRGRKAIGSPVVGRALKAPLIGISVPIRDRTGRVIGVLAGVTDLSRPNFLQHVAESRYGRTGGYLLVDRKNRLIVTASEKDRTMQSASPPGANPTVDRFIAGYEGALVYTNQKDVEILASVKQIAGTDWYFAVSLPTQEAFGPIREMQERMLWATLLLTLLGGVAAWLLLRQSLNPMMSTAALLADMSEDKTPLKRLPILQDDEIGHLVAGFNRLLDSLSAKDVALRRSEARYRASVQASQDFINITRMSDGCYVEVNQAFLDSTGYRRDEVIGRTSIDLGIWADPEDRDRLVNALRRDGKCLNLEARYRRKNGELGWGVMSASLVQIDGEAMVVSVTRETTEWKRADERLRENEMRFRTISELTSDLTYSCRREADGPFVIDWMIGNAEQVLGYSIEAMLSMGCWKPLVLNEDVPVFDSAIAALQPGQSSRVTLRLKVRDGSVRYFDSVARAELADPLGGGHRLYGSLCDVTERRRAEIALTESEAHYRVMYEASQDLIAVVRLDDGVFIEANDVYLSVLGYARDEVVGHSSEDLHIWADTEQRDAFVARLCQEQRCWNHEACLNTRDGRQVWGLVSASIIETRGHACIFSVTRDITKLKETEQELRHYRQRLENLVDERTRALVEANRAAESASMAKSMFLANMSHEIRTPMNAIVGITNILRRTPLTAEQAERLGQIDTATQHLLKVINDILDLSKIEAGKLMLEEQHLSVEVLLADVVALVADRVNAKHLVLNVEADTFPDCLYGDATRIRQALLNYVSNAIKFTEHGTIDLRATKMLDQCDAVVVRFEVRDSGVGIREEDLSRIFSAFEQADGTTTRRHGGTGLGLAITRRLALMMGGEVGVESRFGEGSLFWFSVCLRKASSPSAIEVALAGEAAEQTIREHYAGKRVLLVDDEPVNLEVARSFLEGGGLLVDVASDGHQAVAMASSSTYALILMDMLMPGLDGLDATRQIRWYPQCRGIPIVAMTANAFVEDRKRCIEAGMNDFLSKPFAPETLFSVVLRWLSSPPESV